MIDLYAKRKRNALSRETGHLLSNTYTILENLNTLHIFFVSIYTSSLVVYLTKPLKKDAPHASAARSDVRGVICTIKTSTQSSGPPSRQWKIQHKTEFSTKGCTLYCGSVINLAAGECWGYRSSQTENCLKIKHTRLWNKAMQSVSLEDVLCVFVIYP